jgi:surface protein
MFNGAIAFNNGGNPLNWGIKTSNVTTMNNMFVNATLFNQNISGWNVSNVTNMNGTFAGAHSFDQDISAWDVSLVTNMVSMFASASAFNHPLNWGNKTSNVIYMNNMFSNASAFNQDISGWDVSSVTNMANMFNGAIAFNNGNSPLSWGSTTLNVTDMSGMFSNASAFNQDISSWNVSSVTNMNAMFSNATAFNQDISGWDVSHVINMSNMFQGATAFNQPLYLWDVSQVQYMSYMFQNASSFNQPIYLWDVQNVQYMNSMFDMASVFNQPLNNWTFTVLNDTSAMFFKAFAFNQDISSWNVATVTNMTAMFSLATSFNQDISSWDVSNVEDMSYMFNTSVVFNQPLNNWNVSSVQYMNNMFQTATSFNQPLNNWNVSNIYDMSNMFDNSGLSTDNYNSILNSWATLTLQPDVTMGVLGLVYTYAGVTGRNILTFSPNNWVILGDALISQNEIVVNIPFNFTYYNTDLNSGDEYQLFYNGSPFSSPVTYTGRFPNTLNFVNLLATTTGSLQIVLQNNTNLGGIIATFTIIVQATCFKEDTKILTDKGYIPIQNLRNGDLVKTLKHGYIPISMIGKSEIQHFALEEKTKERLYKYTQKDYPEIFEDLIITGGHSILVDEFKSHEQIEKNIHIREKIPIVEDKYLLLVCTDEKASIYEISGKYTIYHLALESDDHFMNYGIYANGLLVESCSKKYLKENSKMEIL